jgi:hypothetical protein
MTSEAFNRWLAEMESAGLIRRDKEAAALLGVSQNTIVTMKREGVRGAAAERTALACRALLARLDPYA